MADLPSVKWLGLGASANVKSSAIKHGEQQKREAQNEYAKSLPSSKPSGPALEQQWVSQQARQQLFPVGATAAVSSAIPNMPSQAELTVLQDLGWETPGLDKPVGKKDDEEPFNYQDKRIKQSEAFDYGMNEQQIKSLQDLYKDVPGFKPPDQDTATSIRVMAEKNELAPVTWKQWDKMSPDQQKAATWNSLLWKATQRDIRLADERSQQDWSPERQQKYDDSVTKIFGEDGGSEIRAINTVKLLEEVDITAVGHDLDEYLSGERMITAEEMKNFKVGTAEPVQAEIRETAGQSVTPRAGYPGSSAPVGTTTPETGSEITNYEQLRSSENLAKLDAAAVKAVDDEIRERMSSAETIGWNVPSVLSPKEEKWTSDRIPMTYGTPARRGIEPDSYTAQKEEWFNNMWLNLNDPDQKLEDALKDIQVNMQKGGFDQELQQEVWDWIDRTTRWQGEYGRPDDLGYPLRDPHEIRKALGWEK
jgi:hypothetical protein